ncbi:MAG: Gfo/Idh/MocA family oxidoreductase [Planctomycetaceae bacterium]|nr:Gfo/Idh/MocA family oxidoreductase [Planctomycetaceae bacterium]MCB9949525.1 Gfo/Idh/MocA family oxidoreductase [Planctomycetaceae bacterium]
MKRRRFLSQVAAATVLSAAQSWGDDKSAKAAPIKVGQIGVGHAHATKLSVYRESPDYEVVGVVEPNEELRQQAATQPAFADVPWMTTEQLLNTPGLQAVLVETEVRDLLNVAETCVAAGKHVHLDKPAGSSLPQYRRILESATKQNLMVQMGYMYRYNPGVVMLREFLEKGWLGEVFEVHTVMSKVVPPAARLQLAEYPGGIMFELGCHIMDLVIGVLGGPEKVDSYVRHSGKKDDNLLDNMLAVLSYPNAIASVKSAAIEVEGFARRHLTVCGSKGTFHIQPLDNPSVRISLDEAHGEFKRGTQEIALPKYSRYVGDAADMARVIRGEKENSFSPQHDLDVQTSLLKACGLPLDE